MCTLAVIVGIAVSLSIDTGRGRGAAECMCAHDQVRCSKIWGERVFDHLKRLHKIKINYQPSAHQFQSMLDGAQGGVAQTSCKRHATLSPTFKTQHAPTQVCDTPYRLPTFISGREMCDYRLPTFISGSVTCQSNILKCYTLCKSYNIIAPHNPPLYEIRCIFFSLQAILSHALRVVIAVPIAISAGVRRGAAASWYI